MKQLRMQKKTIGRGKNNNDIIIMEILTLEGKTHQ
jgi:hypothetical protein